MKKIAIIISVFLVLSLLLNAIQAMLYVDVNRKFNELQSNKANGENSAYKGSTETDQTPSSNEAIIEESNQTPVDGGSFDSVKALSYAIERNPETYKLATVTVKGYVARNDTALYLFDPNVNGTASRFEVERGIQTNNADQIIKYADYIYEIRMKNDTTNRVLTGDYISLSGVIIQSSGEYIITDCTYQMITPAEAAD